MEVLRSAVLCVVSTVLVSLVSAQSEPVVSTVYGSVRGSRVTLGPDYYVDKFLNIPYARPPIGGLRFHATESPDSWSGVRDGSQYGNICPQPNDPYLLPSQVFNQSEDCLNLNVYRPKVTNTTARLPVMLWIHGGGFVTGMGSRFDWTELSTTGVVVVTINYRLGALGFLTTEDGASVGNYGLLDQIRALEWVRDVISAFNGDPDNVTIFGESAGSMSVSLLVLSRAARGLFHKAIMESGSSLGPGWMSNPNDNPTPRQQALNLGNAVGCVTTDPSTLVACLRTKDAPDILTASRTLNLEFSPVAETTFGQYGILAASPEVILKNNWFADVPTLRGCNNAEMAIGVSDDNAGLTRQEVEGRVQELGRKFFTNTVFPMDAAKAVQDIVTAYYGNITDPATLRNQYIQMSTDWDFIVPTILEVELVTQHSAHNHYVYRFDYRSQNRQNPAWKRVMHVDEIPYVSGAPVLGLPALPNFVTSWTEDDKRISQDLMMMWSNFARFGNPTPSVVDGTKWVPWTQSAHWLEISSQLRMASNPVTPQMKLLLGLLSQMYSGTTNLSPLVG